ncbi:nutA, partial [Symbiodinium pilosum]
TSAHFGAVDGESRCGRVVYRHAASLWATFCLYRGVRHSNFQRLGSSIFTGEGREPSLLDNLCKATCYRQGQGDSAQSSPLQFICPETPSGFVHHWYVKRDFAVPGAAQHLLVHQQTKNMGNFDSLACARFLRHAFFGTPCEALSREVVQHWLQSHLGETDGAISSLERALGPFAPSLRGVAAPASFVFGEGWVEAWYKPLLLRWFLEGQRYVARRRLLRQGFVETRAEALPQLSFWERKDAPSEASEAGEAPEPALLVLHGYGRGLASPLFEWMIPNLNRRHVIIVDCQWLMVTRVPVRDLSKTPTVREIAAAVAAYLAKRPGEVDILGHSFGTAVASALVRDLEARKHGGAVHGRPVQCSGESQCQPAVTVRRTVLMDPMCFIPGISKQAQLLRRTPRDVATELLTESTDGAAPTTWEILRNVVNKPEPCIDELDEAAAAAERRKWIIFQTYFFNYFIFRDLVYCWVNSRALHGPEYLDRGLLREMNSQGRLLTILAETDTMIPAAQLYKELSVESGKSAGVMWLPTVGHGACQHRQDVVHRICSFLRA